MFRPMRFMKQMILFALLVLLGPNAPAKEAPFFVCGSDGIYRGELDADTGKLGPLSLACKTSQANFLALSPDGKSLYATTSNSVRSFAVGADGTLTPLNEIAEPGSEACHVSVDAAGRDVLVAEYNTGYVDCFSRKPDGMLGERTSFHMLEGSGPDKARQMGSHAHSIYIDPANKFVYVCDLGGDDVWIYKFDAAQGKLKANTPLLAKVPPGSGPRHLVFDASGRFVYVASEMGHCVTRFSRDAASGALTPLETVSTLPSEMPAAGVATAEIAIHPSGRWLYVSNRGCDTISEFSIGADGQLTLVDSVSSVAKFPRNFALDPSGRWLIVAGQKDNRLAVLKIDPANGRLTATDQFTGMAAPNCVLFVP